MRNAEHHTKVRGALLLALLAPLLGSGLTGCAYLFPHHSRLNVQPVALAAPDKDALSDDGARAELARRGPERAAEFSWEKTARVTLDVYRRALAQ